MIHEYDIAFAITVLVSCVTAWLGYFSGKKRGLEEGRKVGYRRGSRKGYQKGYLDCIREHSSDFAKIKQQNRR